MTTRSFNFRTLGAPSSGPHTDDILIATKDLDVAASEAGPGTQQSGATDVSLLEADESDTDDMLTDVGNHDVGIGLRHLSDGDWIEDDADNWFESDNEYSESNDGIHGSNNGDNANRARLVRVLPWPSAVAVQAQQGREESKGGNADDCDETEPILVEAPAPAATPVESHGPAAVPVEPPAPATALKRGKRGTARCAFKRPYDQSSWCSNCVTLNAMMTKPRGAAKSYPCTGLQVVIEAPAPQPPFTELLRTPVPRNIFEHVSFSSVPCLVSTVPFPVTSPYVGRGVIFFLNQAQILSR